VGTSVGESLGGADFDGIDDDDEFPEAHEINVTPFIDVMLVLLVALEAAPAPPSPADSRP
jgi:biopolymer transport protein ExbD